MAYFTVDVQRSTPVRPNERSLRSPRRLPYRSRRRFYPVLSGRVVRIRPMMETLVRRFRSVKSRIPRLAVERMGFRASWLGFRWWRTETVRESLTRRRDGGGSYRTVHPETVFSNPLPRNIHDREELSGKRGWWGFSFHDVPRRTGDETFVATLPDCRVVTYVENDPRHPFVGDFYPAVLTSDDRSIELREVRFRPNHAERLRGRATEQRFPRATWIAERVYHNHSHWLTAHLPKLLLLRDQDSLDHVLLPERQSPVLQGSLRRLGFNADDFPTIPLESTLRVGELTLIGSDRFRPELVCSVRDEVWRGSSTEGSRRVFISRSSASRRRLVNEAAIWALLQPHGFERILMEDLSFDAQVDLMMQTAVLVAPHGAGLTNMIFCAAGTQVVELADLSFPNPNFYALACALGHDYWLVPAESIGDGHPLVRDMHTEEASVAAILPDVLARAPSL